MRNAAHTASTVSFCLFVALVLRLVCAGMMPHVVTAANASNTMPAVKKQTTRASGSTYKVGRLLAQLTLRTGC